MSEMSIELDGKIEVIEKDDDGKEISREELDGKVCLQALVYFIEDSIRYVLGERKPIYYKMDNIATKLSVLATKLEGEQNEKLWEIIKEFDIHRNTL